MKTLKTLKVIMLLFVTMFAGTILKAQDDTKITTVNDFSALTLDQLNQHRAALMSYAASDEFKKKVDKIDDIKVPNETGISGVDNITKLLATLIGKVNTNRGAITSMYTGVTGLNLDGTTGSGVQADPQQLQSLATMFSGMSGEIADTAKSLLTLPDEVKSASLLKKAKGALALLWIQKAVSGLKTEIKYNNQLTQNLLATQKLMSQQEHK